MRSQEYYEARFRDRSTILNFDPENPTAQANPRVPPKTLTVLELDSKGAERELRRINGVEGRPGELFYAREAVKETLKEIEHWRTVSGKSNNDPVPPDRQDQLNRRRALVKVLEMESRHLHHIQKVQKKKAERPETSIERRTRELSFKMQEGRLIMFGGRAVTQRNGVDVFEDDPDGETVAEYKARILAERKAKARRKRKREKESVSYTHLTLPTN